MMLSASLYVLHALNILFFVVHTALMGFNLVGWISRRARKLHLACVLATLCSWFVMGAAKGFGYCVCTDWHFQVRRQLGLPVNVHSYLQLIADVLLGIKLDRLTSDVLTGGGLLLVVILTLIVWIHDLRKTSSESETHDRLIK